MPSLGPSIFTSLKSRRREAEWMDEVDVDPVELDRSLAFIRRINRLLGYTRSTIHHLSLFAQTWKPHDPITILDVATGSADVPRAILSWAQTHNHNVHIIGLDRHAQTAAIAARDHSAHLSILRADALALPFADHSVDYVLTALFLHHLDDDVIVRALQEMHRVSRRGLIIADLLRDRRALFWIKLFTLFARPMVRHDAAVSVAQAFSKNEILSLAHRAGLNHTAYHQHFGHRFILAGHHS